MKKLKFLIIFVLLTFIFSSDIYASEKFSVDVNAEFIVQDTGITKVTNTINIKNKTSDTFAKAYVLNLYSINPTNFKAYESGAELNIFKEIKNDDTKLTVEFPEAVAGIGKTRTFVITYEVNSFAVKTGEVWEISIPSLANPGEYKSYNLSLVVPVSFGTEAYVSPEPRSVDTTGSKKIFTFQKDDFKDSGISLGFGEFQAFSFTINYHLENPLRIRSTVEIALPPDTASQKVFYDTIVPEPENVRLDEDGNWIASFNLSGREKADVSANGSVQIFSKARKFMSTSPDILLANLKSSEYWQTDDSEIKVLANNLKTPKNIYDYVVATLTYNYERVNQKPSRMGAKEALMDRKNAICTEFTDLFITIARAAGIPAREINGFAYSENPRLQPLSLVADVLHAWPEYWDRDKKTWISVDPTWEATSKIDYFSKLDLRHFAFVIHGKNSQKPYSAGSYKLGTDPQKDIFVSFGDLPENRFGNIQIKVEPSQKLTYASKNLKITMRNNASAAIYDIKPEITIDDIAINSNFISVLPPYGKVIEEINVPYGFLGLQSPNIIKVKAGRTELAVPLSDSETKIYQISGIFIFLATIMFIIYLKFHKYKLLAINEFIRKKGNIFKRKS